MYSKHKLIFGLLFLCLLIPIITGAEWDNVKEYNPDTQEYTITNALGLGDEIAKVKLDTPRVNKVGVGYVKVAQMTIQAQDNYEEALRDIKFYDMRRHNRETELSFDYKYLTYEDVVIEDYETQCNLVQSKINESIYNKCDYVNVGSHIEKREKWLPFEKLDIDRGNITLGIFTTTREGDYFDFIPVYFGETLDAWAYWIASLDTNIKFYYNFDQASGDIIEMVKGKSNLSWSQTESWGTGILSYSQYVDKDGAKTSNVTDNHQWELDLNQDFSMNFWVNWDSGTSNQWLLYASKPAVACGWIIGNQDDGTNIYFSNEEQAWYLMVDGVGTGAYHMITIVYDEATTNLTGYLDSVRNNTVSQDLDIDNCAFYKMVGSNQVRGTPYDGNIDEFGLWNRTLTKEEIETLYNGGSAIAYGQNELFSSVTLNKPVINYKNNTGNINFNCSVKSYNDIENLSIMIDWTRNYTLIDGIDNFTSLEYAIMGLSEGKHNYTCLAYDNSSLPIWPTINRSFEIDTTGPSFYIQYPRSALGSIVIGNNLTLNWSITETGESLSSYITNCSYLYGGSRTYLNITDCVKLNETSFLYIDGNNSISFTMNDSFNNSYTNTSSWTLKTVEVNQTYNSETIEGTQETFTAVVRVGSGYSISQAQLFYNKTAYTGSNFAQGPYRVLSRTLTTPSTDSDVNASFYWELTLSDASKINLTGYNQTLRVLDIDDCTVFSNKILNFTLIDEEKQTLIVNGTSPNNTQVQIDFNVNILSFDRSENILNISNSTFANPVHICLNINLTNNSNYQLDSSVKYTSSGFATEYYNIQNLSLTNDTKQQDIFLYDLNSTDNTDFQLTFTGDDYLPVDNALVYLQRQYVDENKFKTVEIPTTDSNGQTVLHMVRNEVIYNIIIIKNGEILGTFNRIIAFCEDYTIGACSITLSGASSEETIYNYNDEIGLIYSNPSYNSTSRVITFEFTTTDGTIRTVLMNATRNNIFGNRTACEDSLTSSGGSLSCTVGNSIDDTVLKVYIYVDGELVLMDTLELESQGVGTGGYVIAFLFVLSMLLLMGNTKEGILAGVFIGFMGSIGLGLFNSNLIGLGASGLWLLVVIVIALWKLSKGRQE
jgi:hypothetical protein